MTDSVQEQLLGHLLGALDDHEEEWRRSAGGWNRFGRCHGISTHRRVWPSGLVDS